MPRVRSADLSASSASSSSPHIAAVSQTQTDGTKNARRRRRRMLPPARLAWPGQVVNHGTISSQTSNLSFSQQSHNHDEGEDHPDARTRPHAPSSGSSQQRQLRITSSASSGASGRKRKAAVIGSKVRDTTSAQNDEVSSNSLWIDKYAPTQTSELVVAPKKVKQISSWLQEQRNNGGLLILVGAPGIGKSTLVRLLARDFHLDLVEWTESFYHFDTSASGNSSLESLSPMRHWQQFLRQNSIGYKSLVLDDDKESQPPTQAKRKLTELSDGDGDGGDRKNNQSQRVILLDELPYCHSPEMQDELKESLTQHIHDSTVPSILVWSHNVLEGRHNPADLEALVEKTTLYSNLVTIQTINVATVARFQSTLTRIAKKEGLSLSSDAAKELHMRSGGDIRFALQTLQFENGGTLPVSSLSARKRSASEKQVTIAEDEGSRNGSQSERDVRLTTFHALGKLLYAKRKKMGESDKNESREATSEAPLDFDPEGAIEHSGMELPGSIHFLQYHSLDFFTDVAELSTTWDLYSDAAQLLDFDSASSKKGLLRDAAASLSGRAVAYANRHPAPTKFRQFSKPKSFEVLSIRKANQWRLDQHYSGKASRFQHSREAFATDMYPYARRILQKSGALGSQADSFWDSPPLRSFVSPGSTQIDGEKDVKTEMDEARLEEQNAILEEDDIADFD